ncbi:conserved hypothetical protein [Syntrophobacter sp. SbD1]|nr:conserved hypothetical protein [Syntrophobacter sp. SbD1]
MREINAHRVTITLRDGSVFRGSINIGSSRRLSDFFRKSDNSPFIVIFDTTVGQNKEKGVYFLNWNHILWVEPNEVDDQPSFPGSITLESEPS